MRNSDFIKYGQEIEKAFPALPKIVVPKNHEWDVSGDSWQFIEDNIEWLMEWFDNPIEMNDPEPRFEMIKGRIFGRYEPFSGQHLHNIQTLTMQKFKNSFIKIALATIKDLSLGFEHAKSILYSAVYGIRAYGVSKNIDKEMGGFVEQVGRLPTSEDKCRFIYFGDNGTKLWFTQYSPIDRDSTEIISECCLQII